MPPILKRPWRLLMTAPLISVIVPTFNRAELLNRAIGSVMAQSFKDFDLWIVDDGSTDNTKEVVLKLIGKYKEENKIHYLKTENKGVSSARNWGVEHSKGKWLAFLDSDDQWLKDKLEKQVDYTKENSDVPLVHGEEIWIRKGKRVNQKKIHKKCGGRIFQKCVPLCLISPSAVMIRRDVFNQHGGFDEEFTVCEDYDLWLKLTSLYKVGFIETPIIKKYGGHPDQLSHKFKAMDYWRVRALFRILSLRDLSSENVNMVKEEIIKKSQILIEGYKKHNNMENFHEIYQILSTIKEKEYLTTPNA